MINTSNTSRSEELPRLIAYYNIWREALRPEEKERCVMALTRNFLKSMGLTDEQVNAIIENHTDTVEGLKKERDTYKATAESVESITKERDEYKDKLSKAGDAAKVQADFDAYKQQVQTEKAQALNKSDMLEIAKEAGVQRESFRSMIVRDFDLSKIQRGDDGKVSNRTELLEAVKTGYPDFIATTNPVGTPTANPPAGDKKNFTREQIRTMSPEEINKNWDSIKKNLADLK